MKLKLLFVCLFVFTSFNYIVAQTVSLNEIMASNSPDMANISDDDGDYEDWIELYNYGEEPVNLEGYYLSDDYSEPYMWEFPGVIIEPGEYLIVWASGKNRDYSTLPLHTNFRINMQGEEVFLTSPEGERIDEIAPTPIPTDMSYGRYPDGIGTWHYMENPTPGNSNSQHLSGTHMLVHYWLFTTDIPNNEPLQGVGTFYELLPGGEIEYESCLPGYPYDVTHENWRKASMERRNMPTMFNYREEANDYINYEDMEVDLRGLQVRQPFENQDRKNTLFFNLPTTGFEDIVFRFAAINEGAAENLIVEYSVNEENSQWINETVLNLSDNYEFFEVNFTSIEEVNNNPHFKIMMQFDGENMEEDEEKRVTFNNISLDGIPVKSYYIHSSTDENGMINPFGYNRVYQGESMTFEIFPLENHFIDSVVVDGIDITENIIMKNNSRGVYEFMDVNNDHSIYSYFVMDPEYIKEQEDQVLIFSNPAYEELTIKSVDFFYKIEIANMAGSIIYSKKVSSNNYSLDVSTINSGMYILIIYKESDIITRKIQIM